MTEKQLLQAMRGISAEFILDAAPKPRRRKTLAVSLIAATLTLALLCSAIFVPMLLGQDPPPDVTTEPPQESTAPPDEITEPITTYQLIAGSNNTEELSPFRFTNRNGMDISEDLLSKISTDHKNSYVAVMVFRRNGELFLPTSDDQPLFKYEGMDYNDFVEQSSQYLLLLTRLSSLIEKYGELLKYDKSILTTTGVPEDDPNISPIDKNVWTEYYYENTIAYFNEAGSDFLSKYISNGVFLKEKAEKDHSEISELSDTLEVKHKEAREAYFSRYKSEDIDKFRNVGFIVGEGNGKMCIIAQIDELTSLSEKMDISEYTFALLDTDDLHAAFPQNYLSDDFELDTSVTGFDCSKIIFFGLLSEGYNSYAPTDDADLYKLILNLINDSKNRNSAIEFIITAVNENGKQDFIDLSELEAMNYTYYLEEPYVLQKRTAITVVFDDLNMEALRNLTQKSNVININIALPFFCVDPNIGTFIIDEKVFNLS